MTRLVFVTSNKEKFEEAQAILGLSLSRVGLDLDEVQSLDLSYIAQRKAEAAFAKLRRPLIVDDAGLFIDAWGGFPGPFVAHINKAGGQQLLLQMMSSFANRHAVFRAAIGYHDGSRIHVFLGEVQGNITYEIRGGGWGCDGIFQPTGHTRTFGEMSNREKNTISHRRQALVQLNELLTYS
jgi:XTP/dITP diphosphohydrolase